MRNVLAWLLAAWIVLQGIATVWPVFSEKTIPNWLQERLANVSTRAFGIGSIVVGIVLIALLAAARWWPTSEPEVTNVPTKEPTSVRLRFAGDASIPTQDGNENTFRWMALITHMEEQETKKTVMELWTVFLTFDKPIMSGAAQLHLSFEGAAAPKYEVKDFTPRSAVIVVTGPLPAGVLVIRARYS